MTDKVRVAVLRFKPLASLPIVHSKGMEPIPNLSRLCVANLSQPKSPLANLNLDLDNAPPTKGKPRTLPFFGRRGVSKPNTTPNSRINEDALAALLQETTVNPLPARPPAGHPYEVTRLIIDFDYGEEKPPKFSGDMWTYEINRQVGGKYKTFFTQLLVLYLNRTRYSEADSNERMEFDSDLESVLDEVKKDDADEQAANLLWTSDAWQNGVFKCLVSDGFETAMIKKTLFGSERGTAKCPQPPQTPPARSQRFQHPAGSKRLVVDIVKITYDYWLRTDRYQVFLDAVQTAVRRGR